MTTATVPLSPGPHDGPGLGEFADAREITLTWAEFTREIRQAERTGLCAHPVRLKGRIDAIDLATGELRTIYSTTSERDGALTAACKNRRESVCPACSAVYKRDARQLVRAGLTGGKGIPETVAGHPCVFATFTAPSFGPVHSRRLRGKTVLPCRPRRDHKERRCPHGRDISCPRRHPDDDPRLGRPLCPDCYDYEAAVAFNAGAGELWRRFTTYLPRHLARLAGLTQKQLRDLGSVRYVKVAEYQARGVIHFHAIIRLDAAGETYQPPPARFDAGLLADAIRQAAAAISVIPDELPGPVRVLRFGEQIDPRPIRHGDGLPGTGSKLSIEAVGTPAAAKRGHRVAGPGSDSGRGRAGAAALQRFISGRALPSSTAHVVAQCQACNADVFAAVAGVNGGAPLAGERGEQGQRIAACRRDRQVDVLECPFQRELGREVAACHLVQLGVGDGRV